MTQPLVSVLMASHDGAPFIGEAIESVLAQTYPHVELIVADDASSDATPEIVERYAQAHPGRVLLLSSDVNEGPCRARNRALKRAGGALLCWLDQDDVWLPAKTERQAALLAARPDVGLVYTYFDAFDSESGRALPWPDGRRDAEGDVLADLFVVGCFIGSITTMFRREALERAGGRLRDRDFSIGDDYHLWLTIALDWQVARIPEVLARYRRHAANESARMTAGENIELWRTGLLREFVTEYPEARERLRGNLDIGLAWHTLLAARVEARRRHPARAARLAAQAARLSSATVLRTRLGARTPR